MKPPTCATAGCQRTPARGSVFCGCCLDDERAGRKVLWRPNAGPPPAPISQYHFNASAESQFLRDARNAPRKSSLH